MKIVTPIFLVLSLFTAGITHAQTHTISGFMRDAKSGESLIGAHIINQKTKQGTPINTYGFFSQSQSSESINI